jgi:hypothetical protein
MEWLSSTDVSAEVPDEVSSEEEVSEEVPLLARRGCSPPLIWALLDATTSKAIKRRGSFMMIFFKVELIS